MKYFSGFLFSYKIISHAPSAETNVCDAVVFYRHVYSNVAAPDLHFVLLFTSAVDELNVVRHTHTHTRARARFVKHVPHSISFQC
jgi:hypothetical protein